MNIYTINSFVHEMLSKLKEVTSTKKIPNKRMLLSLTEWVQLYREHLSFLSDKQQILFLYERLTTNEIIGKEILDFISSNQLVNYASAVLLIGIENFVKKEVELDGTRI